MDKELLEYLTKLSEQRAFLMGTIRIMLEDRHDIFNEEAKTLCVRTFHAMCENGSIVRDEIDEDVFSIVNGYLDQRIAVQEARIIANGK